MAERSVLKGNCHCGRYRFELHNAVLKEEDVVKCACGLCKKKGCLWLPCSDREESGVRLEVVRDDGTLKRYRGEEGEHQFCSVCGTTVLGEHVSGELKGTRSVNVRSLRGVDGFGLDPIAEPKEDDVVLPAPPLRASCHCGNVALDVLQPLGELEVKEDDCSICTRNAWLGIYPHSTHVSLPPSSLTHTTSYSYGRKFNSFPFCSTCGVCVFQTLLGPPVEELSEAGRERVRRMLEVRPVNVRCLEGVDVDVVGMGRVRRREGTGGYVGEVLDLV